MAAMSRDEAFAEIAWQATQALGLAETISRIVRFARRAIDADAAGITRIHSDGRLASIGETTSAVARSVALQHAIREGPGVDAATEMHDLTSLDLATDPRWPRWGPQAVDLGLRSVLSVVLCTATDRRLGALQLYAYQARQFTNGEITTVRVFAEHATAALAAAIELEDLVADARSHAQIGQATGILMERYGLDADQAVAVLGRYSRRAHTGLHDLARDVITRRRLPQDQSE